MAPRFSGYATNSFSATWQKARVGKGFTIVHIYASDLKRIRLALPPIAEQASIVRFLDHADQLLIRRYIATKRKLIKCLDEQKQTLVQRAVTRDLDPNVRLNPSGVEWLDDVSEHWEVRRLKTLFREVDDRSDTGTEVLLSLRMHRGLVPHTEVSKVPITAEALIGFKRCRPGQLVMNRMRAAIGMFGIARQPGLVSPDYAVFNPREPINEDFILNLLKTPAMRTVFRIAARAANAFLIMMPTPCSCTGRCRTSGSPFCGSIRRA
jgi:type I restriction enzyme S subunit